MGFILGLGEGWLLLLEGGHALAGERVGALVLGMAGMALHPMPSTWWRRGGGVERLPQIGILDRLPVGGPPAVAAPAVDPAGDAVADIDAVGVERSAARPVSASSAAIAASSSIRLLVVSGSPPDSSLLARPVAAISTAPQPPGPGLPLQAPSVKISGTRRAVRPTFGAQQPRRQLELIRSSTPLDRLLGDLVALAEGGDHLLDQHLGRRGAGGDADGAHALERAPVDVGGRAAPAGRRRSPRARRPRPAAANSSCSARRSPAARRRGAIALTAAWRLEVA